jgi:hypothetical protein
MRGLLVVTARELAERRGLLGVALVAGVFPFTLPYLGIKGTEERALVALMLALCWTSATALLTGASVIGRDLAEARLGFFFARPLSCVSIWGGKMLAAALLTSATLVLSSLSLASLGLPDVATQVVTYAGIPRTLTVIAAVVAATIGLAHAASIGYRSRSSWFAVDLMLAAGAAAWAAHLFNAPSRHLLMPPVIGLVVLAACALTAASAAQIAVGRTDARRGHAALSLVLWGVTLAGLAGLQARTRWLLNPGWSDLVSVDEAEAAPQGDWVAVIGPARGRGRARWTFLTNGRDGRSIAIGGAWNRTLAFAPSGRRAAWIESARTAVDTPIVSVLDLDGERLRPRARALPGHGARPEAIAVSPDGRRLLALERRAAVIADLEGGGASMRVPLPEGYTAHAAFAGSDHVRLFHRDPARGASATLRVLDLDLARGSITEIGRIEGRGNASVRLAPDGGHLLILILERPDRQPALTLHRADGTRLATLVPQGAVGRIHADFLADGSIAVVQKDSAARLRLISPGGGEERALALGDPWSSVSLGGQPTPGQLLVGVASPDGRERETMLVEVASARVLQRFAGLTPFVSSWFFSRDAGSLRPAPGSLATRLFRTPDDGLVEVDLATGQRRSLLAPAASGL